MRSPGEPVGLTIAAPPVGDGLEPLLDGLSALAQAGEPGALPVGLAIGAQALEALAEPAARTRLADGLAAAGLAAVSADGTIPGPVAGPRLKERAYLPDWRDEERLHYTTALAEAMAGLAPEGERISLATIGGAYRPIAQGEEAEADVADGLLRAAAHCVALARRTERHVAIAVEPAPFAMIETAAEAAAFFARRIYAPASVRRFAALADLPWAEAEPALRAHLGLGYDTAHAGVMAEDPGATLPWLEAEGLPVHRLRLSAAVALAPVTAEGAAELLGLAAAPGLQPAIGENAAGGTLRLADLEGAALPVGARLRALVRRPISETEGGALEVLRGPAEAALAHHRMRPVAGRVELLAAGPPEAVARDLAWVRARL